MSGRRGDGGSATVLVLALSAVLVVAAGVAGGLGSAVVARHRAASAADLAALGAAARSLEGERAACRAAQELAAGAGARLVACRLTGPVALVTVEVAAAGLPAALGPARVTARAGP